MFIEHLHVQSTMLDTAYIMRSKGNCSRCLPAAYLRCSRKNRCCINPALHTHTHVKCTITVLIRGWGTSEWCYLVQDWRWPGSRQRSGDYAHIQRPCGVTKVGSGRTEYVENTFQEEKIVCTKALWLGIARK